MTDIQSKVFVGEFRTTGEFERTLVLIKPNAVSKLRAIAHIIKRNGLLILKRKKIHLRHEQATDFYFQSLEEEVYKYYRIYHSEVATANDKNKKAFKVLDIRSSDPDEKTVESSKIDDFVEFMTSGPVVILIVAGRGAISKWRDIMGPQDPKIARARYPNTVRAMFGGETILRNGIYGSSDAEQAEREIRFFFPELDHSKEANLGFEASGEYLSQMVNPVLLKGLIQLCRQKPDNPLVWLADWLLANNPNA